MKPEIKFQDGKLYIKYEAEMDMDKDGKVSSKILVQSEHDAAELIGEIAKKDLGWLEMIIKKVSI